MIYGRLHLESLEEASQAKIVQAKQKVSWSQVNENSSVYQEI